MTRSVHLFWTAQKVWCSISERCKRWFVFELDFGFLFECVFGFVFECFLGFVFERFGSRFIFHFVLCLSPSLNDSCHKLSTFISSFCAGNIFYINYNKKSKHVDKLKCWKFILEVERRKRKRSKLLPITQQPSTYHWIS